LGAVRLSEVHAETSSTEVVREYLTTLRLQERSRTFFSDLRERASVVILDPITDFAIIGNAAEIKATVTRIIDFLKSNNVTGLFVSIVSGGEATDQSVVGVSSLIDAWISLRNLESNGERHRGLFVLKSRGMAHSNQIRSFELTDNGIKISEMDLARRRTELGMS
jgi:KaiC/GvpD/RAD55 family RecA-like ATPase